MKQILKQKNLFTASNWSGGSTIELFIYPDNSNYAKRNFGVRISSATVDESPSAFTLLTGYRRLLMPLTAPLTLTFTISPVESENQAVINPFTLKSEAQNNLQKAAQAEKILAQQFREPWQNKVALKPFEVAEFDGGWKTASYGLCTDIGIMLSKDYNGRIFAADSGVYCCADCFTCVYSLADGVSVSAEDFHVLKSTVLEQSTDEKVHLKSTSLKNFVLMGGDFLIFESETLSDIKSKIILEMPYKNSAIVFFIDKNTK